MIRFLRSYVSKTLSRSFSVYGDDKTMSNDFVEGVVCQESEIPENGMKVCDIGPEGGKVLLIKQGGSLHALGTKCTHSGALLSNGALGNGRVRCPLHGACFNIKTGDIEDFPGLDSIPCYSVEVQKGGAVKVRAQKSYLESNKRQKKMVVRDINNKSLFVIVGGGAAGQVCAETLRQEGFTGQIVIVSAEKYLPYDRVKLSKQLDSTIDKIQLRSDAFYKEHSIEVLLDTRATKLEPASKKVHLSNGQILEYNNIFIATGSKPRRIDLPGVNLDNVFTLRSLDDASNINLALGRDKNVVIYGSSFIGMEAAAYSVNKASSVTVVGRSAVPFQETLGPALGERIAKLFVDKGVNLKMGKTITHIKGNDKVESVVLSDGEVLPADIVLLGLGSTMATEFLEGSGVDLSHMGAIPVNQFLETNCAGVFAGGDIAEAPVYAIEGDRRVAIGHWGLAHYHGRIAARNMASISTPLKTVPFFWTFLFGTSFRYAGHSKGFDDIVGGGNLEDLKYASYFCKGKKVIAVVTVGVDPIAAAFAEKLNSNQVPPKSVISANPLTWHKD